MNEGLKVNKGLILIIMIFKKKLLFYFLKELGDLVNWSEYVEKELE